jgi:hypothetical protein
MLKGIVVPSRSIMSSDSSHPFTTPSPRPGALGSPANKPAVSELIKNEVARQMEALEVKSSKQFPTIEEFCLSTPLYERFAVADEAARGRLRLLVNGKYHLDAHCAACKKLRPFWSAQRDQPLQLSGLADVVAVVEFKCSQDARHALCFIVLFTPNWAWKIGQFPSLADMATEELQRYKGVLGAQFAEFRKGVGLAAHGVGIGAFVYLRRIFEQLIGEAACAAEADADPAWDKDTFQRSRMEDKINLLRQRLPPFLVENRVIYGIMSKGIHELQEQECLAIFPAMKAAIEIILDEKISAKERAEKVARARADIEAVRQQLLKTQSGGAPP